QILEGKAARPQVRHLSERFSSVFEGIIGLHSMRRSATSLLLTGLFGMVSGLWAQQPAPPPPQHPAAPESIFKVDVNLVNVFVTVTDSQGSPVGGLTKDNFILKEDDRDQKISVFDKESALPLSIALAIDTSMSMCRDLPL